MPSTVGREVADLALDLRADREALLDRVPRIRLRLADAQRDLLVLDVDREDDDLNLVADREHVGRARDALRPAELGDVDETLNAGGDLDERAVRGEVDDLARDARADRELLQDRIPRIGRRLLEAQRNALAVAVHVEDHDVELLADLEDFARVLDAAPAHVRDVEEAVDAVEVDERAEVGDVLHAALADLALLEAREELRLLLGERALDELAARDDEVAALVGNLDDLELERLADVGLELAHGRDIDLRAGQERLDVVDLDEEAPADGRLDGARHDAALDIALEDLLPADLVVRTTLRNFDHAGLVVFKLDEHDRHLVADLDVGAFAELVQANHADRLVADVDEHVITLDCADGALDEAAALELRLLPGLGQDVGHRRGLRRRRRRLSNRHLIFSFVCLCARFSAASAPSLGTEVGSISNSRGRAQPEDPGTPGLTH